MVPSYFVCLPKRRDHVYDFVDALGIQNPNFSNMTFKDDLVFEELVRRNVITKSYPKEWMGKVACSMSHVSALRQFLDDGDKHALVFEDDNAIPTHNEANAFWKFLEHLLATSHTWDFVNLSPCWTSACPNHMPDKPTLFKYGEKSFCQNAYLVNRKAAQALIDVAFPLSKKFHALDTKLHLINVKRFNQHPRILRQKDDAHLNSTNNNNEANRECIPNIVRKVERYQFLFVVLSGFLGTLACFRVRKAFLLSNYPRHPKRLTSAPHMPTPVRE